MALAVVFSGWEIFVGNDSLVAADATERYTGVLPGMDAEIAKLTNLPGQDSVAALIVYEERASVAHTFGPLRELRAGWLGTQKTYFKKIGQELVAGIDLAAKTLEAAPPNLERVMLVIGDGCDTAQETAKQRLDKLRLKERGISLHMIQIKTEVSAECPPLPGAILHGTAATAGIDHFVAALR